jgi:hypothetical protein
MAQNNRHEAKRSDDGQYREIFPVAGQNILPPVQRLQIIDEFTRERQQPARSNREPNDRTVSSTIFLFQDFICELLIYFI